MKDIYDLLMEIKPKYSMYTGGRSIYHLEGFLLGYLTARFELGLARTEQEKDLDYFQPWLQEKLHVKTTASWAKIILFYSSDEVNAVELFFQLLEEFINRDKSLDKSLN